MPTSSMVSYPKAARRHFADATLLAAQGRNPNAGQLYGFAAECGIKALLPFDPVRDCAAGSVGKTHIQKIVNQFAQVQTAYQSRCCERYLAMIPSINHFHDWHTDQRYWDECHLPPSLTAWRDAATEVCLMLDQAKQDGRIA